MKAVILAGGLGTRLSEETTTRPKPMVEVGGKPILWHIMKIYSYHGINDFIICCGYKGYQIKEYFANYFLHMSDVTFDMRNNEMQVHQQRVEPWRVTLVDTGDHTMTGGRLLRVAAHLRDEEAFCMTYGDGVGDIDIAASIAFHRRHGKVATMTATYPPGRFGAGFFVLSPRVLDLLDNDQTVWEQAPLTQLAEQGDLMAFEHEGFWQPMDTLRDKQKLEELWEHGQAPWKIWE